MKKVTVKQTGEDFAIKFWIVTEKTEDNTNNYTFVTKEEADDFANDLLANEYLDEELEDANE